MHWKPLQLSVICRLKIKFFITELLAYFDFHSDFQEWDLQIPKAHSLLDSRGEHPDTTK